MDERYCLCGCGGKLTKKALFFVHGHNSKINHPMLGKKASPETISKLKESHKGQFPNRKGAKHTKDSREKMRSSHIGVPMDKSRIEKCRKSMKETWASKSDNDRKIWIDKILDGTGGHSPMKGRRHRDNSNKINSIKQKKLWADPVHARKCLVFNSPNKAELKLLNILESMYPGEWKFVGDGQVIINGKCPDFINVNGQKKIIELYGERWHQDDNPQDRIDIFKPFGYDTLVIWCKELNNKEILTKTIKSFCEVL